MARPRGVGQRGIGVVCGEVDFNLGVQQSHDGFLVSAAGGDQQCLARVGGVITARNLRSLVFSAEIDFPKDVGCDLEDRYVCAGQVLDLAVWLFQPSATLDESMDATFTGQLDLGRAALP